MSTLKLKSTRKIIVYFLFIFMASLFETQAQYTASDNPIEQSKMVFFRYGFVESDTLIYKVRAFDSVVVDYGKPLLRERFEKVRIVCDSVNESGRMFLSSELIEFVAYEADNNIKKQKSTESSWLNRKVFFEIDSLGVRYSSSIADESTPGITVGGAFQQPIVFPIGKGQAKPNRTWMYNSKEYYHENAFPVPAVQQSYHYRAHEPLDTLGYSCVRMDYIISTQGSVKIITAKGKMTVSSIIAGFGIADFSSEYGVPVHHQSSQEVKLTFHLKDNKTVPGVQFINTYVTLDKFIAGFRTVEASETE
ncbi:MAG: hypothetical protein PF588_01770 [Candidatus Kapabacteria bacterium]|jgi:hypothetical protein|nr:hypothetical protein [Candidatus Kapabacteria bacterium]